MQAVIKSLETGKWYRHTTSVPVEEIRTFDTLKQCARELTVTQDGILLKSKQIVLPTSIQKQAVDLAHSGHQGQTKTLALLREKVWFQGMNAAVEKKVKNCLACQVVTPTSAREPLQMSELPSRVWSELSADFGHLPNGQQLLVVTDEYSRYVVVDILDSTSARATIPRLDRIFAEFGLPDQLKTDNGPPFNSYDFKNYMSNMGIHHRKITPLWPRANAETERFMRTVKKCIKTAEIEQKNWKQELYRFLLSYRSTPHTSTGLSPAQILFGRELKTKLPQVPNVPQNKTDQVIRQNDARAKATMKHYADKKQYIKPSNIQTGDNVLVKDTRSIRPLTPYEPIPYTVTHKKGTMITAQRNDKTITRNSSFFKQSPRAPTSADLIEEEELSTEPTVDIPDETTVEPVPAADVDLPNHQLQRPRRTRKMPDRYKDYHMS